jgi:transcription antitermination factor NusG
MSGSYGENLANWTRATAEPAFADAVPTHWFAVLTRYRFEKTVAAQLERKSCGVCLPMLTEYRSWSDREKRVSIPLFPGYVFVRIDESRNTRQAVLQTHGLIGFVSFGGIVAAIPAKQIEDMQLLLREKGCLFPHAYAVAGQRVRIRGGCLQGVEGLLVENEKGKLVISIEMIRRSLVVEVQGYELELV